VRVSEILEGEIVQFPLTKALQQSKRGFLYDEITGIWYDPSQWELTNEYFVYSTTSSGMVEYYSTHTDLKSATLAMKKLKLQGIDARVESLEYDQ